MPTKSLRFCNHPGCKQLTDNSYCPDHIAECEAKQAERLKRYDKVRGNAQSRGYTGRWQKASKAFLNKPENQICKLHLQGCTMIATCVDHIDPHNGQGDSRFWDKMNWQAACIHCNSVKGHKKIMGEYDMMKEIG